MSTLQRANWSCILQQLVQHSNITSNIYLNLWQDNR